MQIVTATVEFALKQLKKAKRENAEGICKTAKIIALLG